MDVLKEIKGVIQTEIDSLKDLHEQIDSSFANAINLIHDCKGKVVISAVGKSGLIGRKIAATLSSTGTPSFFVHSTEAVHGDLGMIESKDIVILISNSGETKEVLNIIPTLNVLGCKKIALTSNKSSCLANQSDIVLGYSYEKEADHLGVAPSSSAIMILAIGDALAIVLSLLKDFKSEDFLLYHPGGSLGEILKKII